MEDAIVIKVKETDKSVAMSVETHVSITERTKYAILLNLMKALEMSVDWMNKEQVDAFSLKMLMVLLCSVVEEARED